MHGRARFWYASIAGGLFTALLYFLLVYARSGNPAAFWAELGHLLGSWRGMEVVMTFCIAGAAALVLASAVQKRTTWRAWQAGAAAGAVIGCVYGLRLLAASWPLPWPDAVSALVWFAVPFVVASSAVSAWYGQAH